MNDTYNVLMVGVGGQGILLASDVLARAAMSAGYDVKKSEIHGMSQRGGAVFSHVRFGDVVHAPVIPMGAAHVIFSLESMETLRWASYAGPDGLALYLGNRILPHGATVYPEAVDDEIARMFKRVVRIDPDRLKSLFDNRKAENAVMLGALSNEVPLTEESLLLALDQAVPAGTRDLNRTAFSVGRTLAKELPVKEAHHVE